ncbi:MAG: DUF1640 domain-containing protein [Magnetococcales bacterium]|nr:DUF1640 domain-containing protein [Magnetococcales bacterium]
MFKSIWTPEEHAMNGPVMFDTLAYTKKLKSVGFSEAQAEVQAETIIALLEERLATKVDIEMVKRDIENSRAELKRDIENTRAELKRDIEMVKRDIENTRAELKRDIENTNVELKRDLKELELRMIIKMGAMILAAVGLLVTAQRLWPIQIQYIPPGIHQETQATPLQTPMLPAVPAQHGGSSLPGQPRNTQ